MREAEESFQAAASSSAARGGSGANASASSPPTSGVEKCLSHFFEPEVLEGRDCDECKKRCGAKRRYVFQDPLPRVLTLHIKRFAQTMTGRLKKLNTYVSYPTELDLGKFCPEECSDEGQVDGASKGKNSPASPSMTIRFAEPS